MGAVDDWSPDTARDGIVKGINNLQASFKRRVMAQYRGIATPKSQRHPAQTGPTLRPEQHPIAGEGQVVIPRQNYHHSCRLAVRQKG